MEEDKKLTIYSFAWGFAEATVLFILPDFFLLPTSIKRPSLWKKLTLSALLGSLLGTLVLILIVRSIPELSKHLIGSLPFTTQAMFGEVSSELSGGYLSILKQPFSGIPVKVWTWVVTTSGMNLSIYIALLGITRGIRMITVSFLGKSISPYIWKLRQYKGILSCVYILLFFLMLYFLAYGHNGAV